MMPWSKLPRHLRGDWRVTQRTPLALAAFFLAWLAADDHGVIPAVGSLSAREALVAQVATLPGVTREAAWEAVGECLTHVLLEEDGLVLVVVDWVREAGETRGPAAGPAPTEPRKAGRPLKGAAPMSARERRVRSAFTHRELVIFRDVPEGTTFEAWCDAHPDDAARLLKGPNGTPEQNHGAGPNENPADRTKLPNETPEQNPAGGRAVSEPSGSSGASEEKNRAREEGESGAPALRTKLANETSERKSGAPNENPAPRTKLPSAEGLPLEERFGFDPSEVLRRMTARSERRLLLTLCSGDAEMEFGRFAHSLIERGETTLDGLVRAAGHAPHDKWVSQQGRLPLQRLQQNNWKILVDLIAGSETCALCGGAPLPPAPDPRTRSATPSVRDALSRRTPPAPHPPKETPRAR